MNFKKYFKDKQVNVSDKDIIAIKLGGLITAVRIHANLSQAQLAKKIGTQQPSLARAEAGDVTPSVEFLYKIAKKVGARSIFLERLSDLFGLGEDKTQTKTKTYHIESSNQLNNAKISPYFKGNIISLDSNLI